MYDMIHKAILYQFPLLSNCLAFDDDLLVLLVHVLFAIALLELVSRLMISYIPHVCTLVRRKRYNFMFLARPPAI